MHWSLLAAAIASVATGSATVDIGPIPEAGSGEIIQMRPDFHERLTVPVTIEGKGPFHFMLDTGAQATVLSVALADRLMLPDRHQAVLVGMASRRPVVTTMISEFGLGSRVFPIRIAPLVEGENIGGADGILGIDSLQGQRVMLDFKKQEIAVADAKQLGGNRGFEIVVKAREKLGQLIITHASIDGVRTAVLVDTGAQGTVGNPALMRKLWRSKDVGASEMTDVNGEAVSGVTRQGGALKIGRAAINRFPITFADSPTFHALGLTEQPAIILGMSELKLFNRVAIDFEQRRILFDLPAGAVSHDDPSRRSF
jgi:predicted aspartyl protease